MPLAIARLATPLGDMQVVSDPKGLCAIDFSDCEDRLMAHLRRRFGEITLQAEDDPAGAVTALKSYFNGHVTAINTLPANPGGTPFQQTVWRALRQIPVGTRVAYGAFAKQLGHPSASRAVGNANGKNPLSIVVPCHRLVGANGALTGYAGGIERKRWLLAHEEAGSATD